MRVLLVHNRYRYPGGEERHVDLLASSLVDAAVDVFRLEVSSASVGTSWARLRAAAAALYEPRAYRLLHDEVRRVRADVVHFHNIWPLLTPAALRGARDAGARVVLTAHNYRFACPNGTLLRHGTIHDDCLRGSSVGCGLRSLPSGGPKAVAYGVALSLQRRLGLLNQWVDAFVAPSRFVADALGHAGYDERRIHVIRHGIPAQRVAPFPSERDGHLLFVGRLSLEKGLGFLLAAAALVPQIPLVVAGEGPLAGLVQSSGRSVSFVGQCDPDALAALRSVSIAAIVPSVWHEPAGLVALESAAARRPVLATTLGALPEFVRHEVTGLLVPPNDTHALADAMSTLWTDRTKAAELGRAAAELVYREHSLASMAMRHLAVYQECAER